MDKIGPCKITVTGYAVISSGGTVDHLRRSGPINKIGPYKITVTGYAVISSGGTVDPLRRSGPMKTIGLYESRRRGGRDVTLASRRDYLSRVKRAIGRKLVVIIIVRAEALTP